jgi:microcystin-dependent protein
MTLVTLPYRPQPGQTEDISQIMADFDAILSVLNGGITNDNIAPNANISPGKVPGALPIGALCLWGTDVAPTGWLLCDGAPVSRTTYQPLFDVIGTRYGTGDNSTTFNLPNFKGRVATGLDSAQTEFNAVAKALGSKAAVLPTHAHPGSSVGAADRNLDHTHNMSHDHASQMQMQLGDGNFFVRGAGGAVGDIGGGGAGTPTKMFFGNTGGAGSTLDHLHALTIAAAGVDPAAGNLAPYLVVTYIIKT